MSVGPVRTDAGVEMKLLAPELASLLDQPLEQAPSMSAATGLRKGREVVDVEEAAPGDAVPEAEARDRCCVRPIGSEGAHEPVALGALNGVDDADEFRFARQQGSKRA